MGSSPTSGYFQEEIFWERDYEPRETYAIKDNYLIQEKESKKEEGWCRARDLHKISKCCMLSHHYCVVNSTNAIGNTFKTSNETILSILNLGLKIESSEVIHVTVCTKGNYSWKDKRAHIHSFFLTKKNIGVYV